MGVAVGGLTMVMASAPARAQFYFGPPVLPQRAVIDVLREEGFRRISPPILNRDVYFLDAVDPDGAAVRLIVDAYSGDIIKAHLRSRRPWQEAEPGWEGWDEPLPHRNQPRERPQKQATVPAPRLREPAPTPPTMKQPPSKPPVQARPAEQPKPKPPVAAAPQGTKAQPRVIELSPAAPSAPPTVPPVAPLDDVPARTQVPTPYVPPAPLE